MKKYIIVLSLISLVVAVKAQQLPLYSQYMMNGFLLNPAIAGSVSYSPIRLTVRQQWAGLKDSPKTQALSFHTLLSDRKNGVGGYIFNDDYGPISRSGLQAAFAHHLNVNSQGTKLSFGVSASVFQIRVDETDMTTYDGFDPVINGNVKSQILPDATFGAYLYNDDYFVGFSAAQLFQFKVNISDQSAGENKLLRHYFATAGYNFDLGNDFMVQPSVLMKATTGSPAQLDFNVKGIYKNSYWAGVSFRTNDAFIAIVGVKYKQLYFGYAFDYPLSSIAKYSVGSHEIMIGYDIPGKSKGSSLL